MAEQIGTFDRMWLSADDATYTAIEFLEGTTLGLNQTLTDTNGIRGTRQHSAGRVRETQRQVSGTIQMAPVASELDLLLPWILGGNENADAFPLAEAVPARFVKTYRDGTKHLYNGLKVNRAVFSAAEGGPLGLALDVVGIDEAVDTDPTEADAIDDDAGPYVMSDCVLTVGGQAHQFRSISIEINNALQVRFNNSVTPSSISATDLMVGVNLSLPYGDTAALYGSAISGVAVVAMFTNGNRSIAFNLAGVSAPKQPLPLGQRGPRDLTWAGTARRTTGGAPPIAVTNDSTG
ncbi:hypothetical protein GobsT_63610 [Gemmata obscuriglobus]|uniref:Phage tail protein n=1 Tax=Gemmata obscuriglobus TaxID=114 RepID=A0A2Z3GWY3_9BACT|nr:phage tail tube protein [Gemmata obscuriglobus]AWM35906.1 hypothetical protein C1280_02025 [Gemmata obscuriglobus]QEG31539.1 hypothetical protein GobsT_63610 [Gemmata obscuriglobus]VTS10881.1 Uncharacterized protein OS=Planctomyces brasiliensis (strain ATCC 49424 / DSM 5305 / JCM 21570 / NBRC 103401 / IFAM 1448) GN=Plabr_0230 PE=4 SV=1 [Gemmata obscuriglobus UQM 2246]